MKFDHNKGMLVDERHEKPLTLAEVRALGRVIKLWAACLPPPERNVTKMAPGIRQMWEEVRTARLALSKVRYMRREAL